MSTRQYIKNLLVIILLTTVQYTSNVQAQPTIYIVRHAEKLTDWPGGTLSTFQPLSAEGIERAEQLAKRFDANSLKAIYSSTTTRTLHTVFPLSKKLNLPIKTAQACMDTSAIDAFFEELQNLHSTNDAVLLVSHSNIIPYLLIKAGLPEVCQKSMGFTTSLNHSWIVIEGYKNIWIVAKSGAAQKDCMNFKIMKY